MAIGYHAYQYPKSASASEEFFVKRTWLVRLCLRVPAGGIRYWEYCSSAGLFGMCRAAQAARPYAARGVIRYAAARELAAGVFPNHQGCSSRISAAARINGSVIFVLAVGQGAWLG